MSQSKVKIKLVALQTCHKNTKKYIESYLVSVVIPPKKRDPFLLNNLWKTPVRHGTSSG